MKLHKLLLIIIFISGFAYGQGGWDYQIIRYEPADTCWIIYAPPFDSHGKPFPFEFEFWCSQTFKDKYKIGSIFNYVTVYCHESWIRLFTVEEKNKMEKG